MKLNDQKIQEYQPCKNGDQKCLDYNSLCATTEEEKIKQKCFDYHLFCSIAKNNIESVRFVINKSIRFLFNHYGLEIQRMRKSIEC